MIADRSGGDTIAKYLRVATDSYWSNNVPLYISVDLDGIDPSEAPGVSHPEPGGLRLREVLDCIAKQTAQIVGADIVELNPTRDLNDVTAILAAKLVREIAARATINAGVSS